MIYFFGKITKLKDIKSNRSWIFFGEMFQ